MEYERFADIYAVWTATAGVRPAPTWPFYVAGLLAADGPVVELGVGDGRLAVRGRAVQGRDVIGVDLSPAMLDAVPAPRRDAAGVLDRLTLHAGGLPRASILRRARRAHRAALPQSRRTS
ncbi:MAG: class I SAM-dependent methyltransferase [Comamonadaceae bacterium]|nr:class I SAM-dependent methyltransferase [Comamonadaceae bacterium]